MKVFLNLNLKIKAIETSINDKKAYLYCWFYF